MEMKNCRRCGKIFSYNGNHICTECVEKEEEEFKIVKEYIYDHPKCSVTEVSEATGVTAKTIMNFLRQDRLEAVEGMSNLLTCEKCGVPIKSGRYCESCVDKLKKETSKLLNESESTVSKVKSQPSARGIGLHVDGFKSNRG